ncbi:MAG: hypothetical protein U0X91_18755 [Spirosomataceae bacterium]
MKKTKDRQAEFTKWLGPLLDALRDLGGAGRPKVATDRVAKNLNIPHRLNLLTDKNSFIYLKQNN